MCFNLRKFSALLLAAFVLIGTTAQAAMIPTAATYTIGSRVFTDLTNLIILACEPSGATNRYSGCRVTTGSSGYTPSGGKKLHIYAVRIENDQTVASANPYLVGSCDNDLSIGTSTAPTTPVYFGSSSSLARFVANSNSGGAVQEWPTSIIIPNTKFAFTDNQGTASQARVLLFGYEE